MNNSIRDTVFCFNFKLLLKLTFLEVNGIHMDCTNEDVATVGLSVADGSMSYEELLAWVRDHASF